VNPLLRNVCSRTEPHCTAFLMGCFSEIRFRMIEGQKPFKGDVLQHLI